MYSEIIGTPYEIENDFAVGMYYMKDFPQIELHINIERNEIIEVWLQSEE